MAMSPHQDFSLVVGGPLYQFYLRSHLSNPPPGGFCRRGRGNGGC